MNLSKKSISEFISTNKWVILRVACCLICSVVGFCLLRSLNSSSIAIFGFILFTYVSFVCAAGLNQVRWLNGVLFWLMPVVNFFMLECFMHDPFENIQIFTMLFNISLYYLAFLLVWFFTKNDGVTVIVSGVLAFGIGLANYVVIAFRASPILPWDLMSVGTAVKVVNNYTLPITSSLVLLAACFLSVLFFGISVLKHKRSFKKLTRIIVSVCLVAVFIGCSFFAQSSLICKFFFINESLFIPFDYFKNNGYVVGFIRSLQYMNVDKPVGYSKDEVVELFNDYGVGSDAPAIEVYPNIIVVMNESFSDLSVLGEFTTNEEYTPYFDSLAENVVKGDLHVSVKGGNTANSEFEFLTGNSMAFLPSGSIPYVQFINKPTSTIVSYLKDNFGYSTYAVHPYYASAYNRGDVYPLLGFDKLLFLEDFDEDSQKLRRFTSDAATYDKIIELYENRVDNERFFSFCITLQNHGGYDTVYDNFQPSVTVDGLEDDVSLSQYLSLMKESDAAFKDFIEYFANVDEPTVILMFGDHQPTDEAIRSLLNNVDLNLSDLKDFEKQYTTKFALWTNYDIQEQKVEYTSCNYLSTLLLDTVGIPLSPYQNYLKKLQNKFPVVTANCAIDKDGNYLCRDEFLDDKQLIIYNKLQYYEMFDCK